MRPMKLIDYLKIIDGSEHASVTLRGASGHEVLVDGARPWYFDADHRTLSVIVNGSTMVVIDPMLIEAVVVSEPEADRSADP